MQIDFIVYKWSVCTTRTEPVLITIKFKWRKTFTRKSFAETQNLTKKQAVLSNTGKVLTGKNWAEETDICYI